MDSPMRYFKKFYYFLLILMTLPQWLIAQGTSIHAGTNANTVALDQEFTYSVSAENYSSDMQIIGPNLADFEIVSGPFQNQGTSVSMNGSGIQSSSYSSVEFVLRPKRVGTFIIKGAGLKSRSGKFVAANAISIKVLQTTIGNAKPPAGQVPDPMQQAQNNIFDDQKIDEYVFLKAEVDKTNVVVGEQVNVVYKLYTVLRMSMQATKMPQLNGFWSVDESVPNANVPQQENYNGRRYQVFTLRKVALFPQHAGTLSIDPANATGWIEIPSGDIFGFDEKMQKDLASEAIKINVRNLPSNSGDFSGAVGRFSISAQVPKTNFTTDDIIQLKFTIEGKGNLGLINAPNLNLPQGLSSLSPDIHDSIQEIVPKLYGYRQFTYNISADAAGSYTIPATSFTYYDTDEGQFKVLQTQDIKLYIAKGKLVRSEKDEAKSDMSDIHDIKTSMPTFENGKDLAFSKWYYWALLLLPIAGFTLAGFAKKHKIENPVDPNLLKQQSADKVAWKRLSSAREAMQQNKLGLFYEEISKAIGLYLSEKLNVPLSKLSKENISLELQKRNVDATLIDNAITQIQACEMALYTPDRGAALQQKTMDNASKIIGDLENQLKQGK